MSKQRFPTLLLCVALVAGCKTPATPTRPAPKGTASPAVATTQLVEAVTLTGKVKIISNDGGGIISDNGGGIISDNGGGVISNNSGNIIGNNGGAIVANNGGSLTSKVKRHVLAASAHEYLLADATVIVQDASGKPVLDAAGKPISAVTDATGNYHLSASLPAGNLVLKVLVHDGGLLAGGELTAMLPKRQGGARTAGIDTSSSLGAAYVLGKYVKGDQKTFDKLPADEADKLSANLDAARKLLTAVPHYTQDDLTALTEKLRGQAKDLDSTLTEIQALLIGQAGGGDGQQATNAALASPTGLAFGANGEIYVGEPVLGRIRTIGTDGKIGTLADTIRGKVKRNFPKATDLKSTADGTLYVAAESQIFRISPDGKVDQLAGNSRPDPTSVDVPAVDAGINPGRLALAADGTLYVGERRGFDSTPSRLLAIDPSGILRRIDRDGDWPITEQVVGVAPAPDGSFDLLLWEVNGSFKQRVVHLVPGQKPVELWKSELASLNGGYMLRGPDGTRYFSDPGNNRVLALAPDNALRVVAGAGGPAGTQDLTSPRALLLGPDGTLFIADVFKNLLRALGPSGSWTVRAGTTSLETSQGDLRSLALNGPSSAVFDAQGRLIVSEAGASRIDRFDGGKLEVLAGDGERGHDGDGGPAAKARFNSLICIDEHQGSIFISDDGILRVIGPDQVIRALAGVNLPVKETLAPTDRFKALDVTARSNAIAVAADGRTYLGTNKNQLIRVETDGTVTLIAGTAHDNDLTPGGASTLELFEPKQGDGGPALNASFHGINGLAFDPKGDLYVVDSGAFRVRKITGLDGDRPMIDNFAGVPVTALLEIASRTEQPPLDTLRRDTMALIAPVAVATDKEGNVYITDAGTASLPYLSILAGTSYGELTSSLPTVYSHVYKITPDDKVHCVAGPGGKFFPDPTAEDGMILPFKLSVSPDGRLAIVDSGANLIRVLPAHSF